MHSMKSHLFTTIQKFEYMFMSLMLTQAAFI